MQKKALIKFPDGESLAPLRAVFLGHVGLQSPFVDELNPIQYPHLFQSQKCFVLLGLTLTGCAWVTLLHSKCIIDDTNY